MNPCLTASIPSDATTLCLRHWPPHSVVCIIPSMAEQMMAVPATTSESSCQLARARIRKMRRAMRRGLERALGSALSSGPDGEDSSVRFASTGLGLKEEVIIAIETLVAQLAPEVGYSRVPSRQFNGSARAQQHFAFGLPRHSTFVFPISLTRMSTPRRASSRIRAGHSELSRGIR